MLFFSFLLVPWMLCETAQNDKMELQDSGFLRMDLDEWQSEDSSFMEVKKKKVRTKILGQGFFFNGAC